MCGIAGFVDRSAALGSDQLREIAGRMGHSLRHRGPTSSGRWIDAAVGVALAHRRLAIIDVSAAGHQPMSSHEGRYILSFNGEIYNHLEIRRELQSARRAPEWRGHSDTETILAAVAAWGVGQAIARLTGMFALAVWDRETRTLYLARDRIGEKPLYYGFMGGVFLFGSELKALRQHPQWSGEIDRGALSLFMRHGYVPTPYAINVGVRKLPPGIILSLAAGDVEPQLAPYWSLDAVIAGARAVSWRGSIESAVDGLESLLLQVVRDQMLADVPLGAFLSGGLDSSTIVALMQAQSSAPVRTFTIGFDETLYDESAHARAVAAYLGTNHTELIVKPREALDALTLMPDIYDEPFGDSSQIPTYLLARLASADVTVALSGDGGDELFGGYDRYSRTLELRRLVAGIPGPFRQFLKWAADAASIESWDRMIAPIAERLSISKLSANPGEKISKWSQFLSGDLGQMYRLLASQSLRPSTLVREGAEPPTVFGDPARWRPDLDPQSQMMALDLLSYLPDDILVKVDRAAMAVSLETRIPLLDPRVVAYAWSLPDSFRENGSRKKWILRQVLYRYVPPALVDRPKRGFAVPIDLWLRGPLRQWADSLLDPNRVRQEGVLEWVRVDKLWRQFLSGADIGNLIWNILMFQAWQAATPWQTAPDIMKQDIVDATACRSM